MIFRRTCGVGQVMYMPLWTVNKHGDLAYACRDGLCDVFDLHRIFKISVIDRSTWSIFGHHPTRTGDHLDLQVCETLSNVNIAANNS